MDDEQAEDEALVDSIFYHVFSSPRGVNAKYVANALQVPVITVNFILKELAYDGALHQKGTWYYG